MSMMIIVALIMLFMGGIGLLVFFCGIKKLNDGEVAGFFIMALGLILAFTSTLACYHMPVKYGLSYTSPDTIFKTNGVTVVIYNHFEDAYTTTDPKWFWASNENIQIECKSNTNIWHKALTPCSRPVVK